MVSYIEGQTQIFENPILTRILRVTHEQVIEHIGEKRALLNKTNLIGYILRTNLFLHATEGKMVEVKGVGRGITYLLDGLRNRRRYWKLKEEAEDRKRWKRQFINRP